jgi:hypothetical protein
MLILCHVVVETADKNTMKKYKQVFSDNMSKKGTPKVNRFHGKPKGNEMLNTLVML